MGTMAEDLVAPSVPRVLRQLANCSEEQLEYVAVRAKKRNAKTNQIKEFDVIVVCGDYLLVNETKSALVPSDVDQFVVSIPEVRDYYPHYAGKKVIGALALSICGREFGALRREKWFDCARHRGGIDGDIKFTGLQAARVLAATPRLMRGVFYSQTSTARIR